MSGATLQWFAVLAMLALCLRAAISNDGRTRKTWAVGAAFLPSTVEFLGRAPGPQAELRGVYPHALANLVPPLYLIAWASRTADPRWLRIPCAILGAFALLGIIMLAILTAGAATQYSLSQGS